MQTRFLLEGLKGKYRCQDLDVDEKIILKFNLGHMLVRCGALEHGNEL